MPLSLYTTQSCTCLGFFFLFSFFCRRQLGERKGRLLFKNRRPVFLPALRANLLRHPRRLSSALLGRGHHSTRGPCSFASFFGSSGVCQIRNSEGAKSQKEEDRAACPSSVALCRRCQAWVAPCDLPLPRARSRSCRAIAAGKAWLAAQAIARAHTARNLSFATPPAPRQARQPQTRLTD